MHAPATDDWVGLSAAALPIAEVDAWVVSPRCGAVVVFTGRVRDHADGRDGVTRLDYEAYDEYATARMQGVVDEVRTRWPEVGRIAILHRTGELAVGDAAVLVAVAAPHRAEAFTAASFAIDAVKATVPIWKREHWGGRHDWGTGSRPLAEPADVTGGPAR